MLSIMHVYYKDVVYKVVVYACFYFYCTLCTIK